MRAFILCCLLTLPSFATSPIDYVDPLIGTTRLGNTYPAVCTPFGLCKWTPQTRAGEKKGDKPYDYQDAEIQGIRWTNFISGSAVPEYGSHTFGALTGSFNIEPKDRASHFSHENEKSSPYYYSVLLDNYQILVEVTSTTRAGYFRFTFPKAENAKIFLQPNNVPRAPHTKGDAYIKVIPERNEIVGYNPVYRYYIATGQPAGFSGYFVARLSEPITSYQVWEKGQFIDGKSGSGQPGVYVQFSTKKNQVIEMKVGCSFVSIEGARANLDAELPEWNFQAILRQTKTAWEKALGKIDVAGTNENDKIKFYTALYHCFFMPRLFNDVDGSFPGFARTGPQQSRTFNYYEDYSMWDTFRALHPLLLLIQPERINDMIESLLVKADLGGWLPIFPSWNSYTTEMIGDHVISMITDAYVKGYRDFETEKAFSYMKKNATEMPETFADYADGKGRRAVTVNRTLGYIPLEHPVKEAFHQKEQVSRTLEYAYDDFCLSEFAKRLGKEQEASDFRRYAYNYVNVFDVETGFVRGRTIDGYWDEPFDPAEHYKYICEATPWVYTWYVPHDIQGLIRLLGSRQKFIKKLDTFFEEGYYAHDNEPSHQIAYLYNFAGAPWKTQERVRDAMRDNYTTEPGGLTGNDDSGQMSAWYIFSALGFYPVCPGTDQYIIGSPVFEQVTIYLDPPRYKAGTILRIKADNASEENKYIQTMRLNGQLWEKPYVCHADIENGGEIVFEMGAKPNVNWGTGASPYSMSPKK
ncbi:glycoside hydrolase family 92 protein [candidate division KSB1 bacterium]|nr:GH92 family glycosyl hydrolase [candidate division KSB1 bacterium]RQW01220.1 MAG: glycoside hydrolase family 92 protein [candidate division KSB1 bacterium]